MFPKGISFVGAVARTGGLLVKSVNTAFVSTLIASTVPGVLLSVLITNTNTADQWYSIHDCTGIGGSVPSQANIVSCVLVKAGTQLLYAQELPFASGCLIRENGSGGFPPSVGISGTLTLSWFVAKFQPI